MCGKIVPKISRQFLEMALSTGKFANKFPRGFPEIWKQNAIRGRHFVLVGKFAKKFP